MMMVMMMVMLMVVMMMVIQLRAAEDSGFDDFPALLEHKRRLQEKGEVSE